jgi:hypothetical protein
VEKKNSRSMLSESEKLPHLTEPTNTHKDLGCELAVNGLIHYTPPSSST